MARLLTPPQDRRDVDREREDKRERERGEMQRQGILEKWTVSLPVMARPVDDDDEDDADAP